MTNEHVLKKIIDILVIEKNSLPNWNDEVSRRSLILIGELHANQIKIDQELYKYLDDFDLRKSDSNYANYQLEKVERIVDSL